MRSATAIDPMLGPSRTTPPLRLALARVMGRVFVVSYVVLQVILWTTILRRFGKLPGFFVLRLLFQFVVLGFIWSVLAALVATHAGILFVRLVVRPLMARWYDPRPADASIGGHAPFRLASSEWVVDEIPGRRRSGRLAAPGHLVLTNLRVWFFPSAWDSEPWSAAIDRLDHVRLVPSHLAGFRAVRGWPDELIFRDEDGDEARFALADPMPVLDWFEETDVPVYLHNS